MSDFIPANTGLSRVFLIPWRAGPTRVPEYHSCLRAQAVSQGFGEVTDIECPDPTRPGKYIKIGSFQTGVERATVTLEGRYALDVRSALLKLAKQGCAVDLQVHFGDCQDLSDHNDFKKILYLQDALLSAYNTEDLGSLASGDTAAVNESVDISARDIFDIVAQTFGNKGGDLVTNKVIDGVICDEVSCGECGDTSDGCQRAFVISIQAGGSPGTPADVIYTVDGGTTWYAHDIDSLGATDDPSAVACLKGFLVVVSEASGSAHYAPLADFDAFGTDPDFTAVTTGFVAGGDPTCIVSLGTKAFIGGDGGHVYSMETPSNGVTLIEDGVLTPSRLLAIDALSDSFVVAVGEDGVILFSEDGATFQLLSTSPVGVGVDVTAVAIKNKNEWWVGTSAGNVYFSIDAGAHWTVKAFPGSGAGTINDITIQSESIMYIAQSTTGPAVGRLLGSFNGGYDFIVLPLGSGVLPTSDILAFVAACDADPGFIVTGGLGANGADGIIITGTM
jgi:hypothetical protein